jgi:hypothetical protein
MRTRQHLAVVVLGDVGHSPRMQNHAIEIARETDYQVHMVGYIESMPCGELINSHYVTLHDASCRAINRLRHWPRTLYPLYALLRFTL